MSTNISLESAREVLAARLTEFLGFHLYEDFVEGEERRAIMEPFTGLVVPLPFYRLSALGRIRDQFTSQAEFYHTMARLYSQGSSVPRPQRTRHVLEQYSLLMYWRRLLHDYALDFQGLDVSGDPDIPGRFSLVSPGALGLQVQVPIERPTLPILNPPTVPPNRINVLARRVLERSLRSIPYRAARRSSREASPRGRGSPTTRVVPVPQAARPAAGSPSGAPPVVNSPAASAMERPTPLPSDADTAAPEPFHFPDEMAEDSDSTVRAASPLTSSTPVGATAGGLVPTAVVRPVPRLPPPAASDVERPDSGSSGPVLSSAAAVATVLDSLASVVPLPPVSSAVPVPTRHATPTVAHLAAVAGLVGAVADYVDAAMALADLTPGIPPATNSSILISFSSRGQSAPASSAALDLSAAVATADESAADDSSDSESIAAAAGPAIAAEPATAAIGPTNAAVADSTAAAASERFSDDTLNAEFSSIFDI